VQLSQHDWCSVLLGIESCATRGRARGDAVDADAAAILTAAALLLPRLPGTAVGGRLAYEASRNLIRSSAERADHTTPRPRTTSCVRAPPSFLCLPSER
jgi:hypothetical protein